MVGKLPEPGQVFEYHFFESACKSAPFRGMIGVEGCHPFDDVFNCFSGDSEERGGGCSERSR